MLENHKMDDKEETGQTVYITYNYNDLAVASFISYLVPALYSQEIDAVYEKSGHKLESIRFSNIKLFLVVFSYSYAPSVACLENLLKLLEFRQKQGRVVLPVFYDAIDKQQMDIFGEAFAVLEKSYSADQVTKWRCLLEETMELQGHEYTAELSEQSECIEEIARGVSEKLRPTENIGIHKLLPKLNKLQCKQAWGHRSIGIYGVPGIGKTALAKAAFRRLQSGGYDASHFIIVTCKEKRVKLFSTEEFNEVPMEKFGRNNQDAEPCYRRKRVLLVLDDVRNPQEVKYFLDEFGRFGPGSLLIITSRDIKVLQGCLVNEIYEVKGLNNEDSLKLFSRCVYGEDVVKEKIPEHFVREIECFGGNPSSIRLYAEEMKNKNTKDKETALSRSWDDQSTDNKNIPSLCFQATTKFCPKSVKQSVLTDLLRAINVDLNLEQHNNTFYIEDLSSLSFPSPALESLPSDIRIPHFGQESVVAYQAHHLPPSFMEFREYSRLESILLNPIQVINFGGCIETKHFPDLLQTMRELNIEGLQWRLKTQTSCPLCNSAKENETYLSFEITISCWNETTRSKRIHISPLRMLEDVVSALVNLTGKAKKILSRTTWQLNIYSIYSQGFIRILPKFLPHRTSTSSSR